MSTSDYPKLPLQVANEIEARRSWEDICNSPQTLALWISRTFAVDASQVLSLTDIYVGADAPTGGDYGKLWVKNTNPPAIGVPFNSGYHLIYPYPIRVPLLWTQGESEIPTYMRQLSGFEIEQMGLNAPAEDSGYIWVIAEDS